MEYCVDKEISHDLDNKILVGGTETKVESDNSVVAALGTDFGTCGWSGGQINNPIPFYSDLSKPSLSISSYPNYGWITANSISGNTINLDKTTSALLAPFYAGYPHIHLYMNMYADFQCPATFSNQIIRLASTPVYNLTAGVTKYKIKNINQLQENEYRYDYKNQKIYLNSVKSTVYVSSGINCIISLTNQRGINITNLTLFGGTDGIRISGCNNILIKGCHFRDIPKTALVIDSSSNITVEDCSFESIGFGAIFVNKCGSYDTLTSGNIQVLNCTFKNVNKTKLTNAEYIETAYGVGLTVTNCAFYNSPAAAIKSTSNNTIISQCYFENCCCQTSDFGIIYQGRSFTKRGLSITDSWFFGLAKTTGWSRNAIYCDDGYSGASVKNCIFENIEAPNNCFFSFGRDHLIENCTFLNVNIALKIPTPRIVNASVVTEYNSLMANANKKRLFCAAYPALNIPIQLTQTMKPSVQLKGCVVFLANIQNKLFKTFISSSSAGSIYQENNSLLQGTIRKLPVGSLVIPIINFKT